MSRKKFDIRYKELSAVYSVSIDISSKDLNDIKSSGIYHGFNVINSPDEYYVSIIVTKHNESWIVQEAKNYIDKIFLRSFKNDSWGEWKEIVTEFNCDNPDKEYIIVERPHTHGNATSEHAGFMSPQDKQKLDSIDLEDGGISIKPGDHFHKEYEDKMDNLSNSIRDLELNKSNKDHEHDERYIPAYSKETPDYQSIYGQVWIELK